ncbi:unnamed protein product [Parnassius apollo]|uniref:(apollo) hypothetical protein n=1 Tax=Parnassius apollo TaxID=110799 RepID=A0A8S3Y2S9_PARAO|nr:unnamed protein product [Parnassius apollo]
MNIVKWISLIMQTICVLNGFDYYHEQSMQSILMSKFAMLPNGSYFGYSITYQSQSQSLVISAPMADKIGQVFNYDIKSSNLTKIDFEIRREVENVTNYWLGATVKAGPSFFTLLREHEVLWKIKDKDYLELDVMRYYLEK